MIATLLALSALSINLDAELQDPVLQNALPGVCVMNESGEILYARHGDTRLVPASNQKLLSTIYALERLGADYIPQLKIWKVGDKIFVDAPGTPTLTREDLFAAHKAIGSPKDAAIYVRQKYNPLVPPTWEYDDLPHRYAARVSALSFDRGGFEVWGENGVATDLPPEYKIKIRNVAGEKRRLDYDPWKRLVKVTGPVPKKRSFLEAFAMPDPDSTAARILGGTLVNTTDDPPATAPLYTFTGPALIDTIKECLEKSDNNHAEQLLLMAAATEGPFESEHYFEAADRMRKFLTEEVGLDEDEVRPIDGSGMSRHNLVSPSAICDLLLWAKKRPWYPEFHEALAAGGEGTLSSRLKTSKFVGKTGTLSAVVSLSGYLESASGETYIVSMLFNNTIARASEVRKVQDRIVGSLEREEWNEVGCVGLEKALAY